MRLAIANCQGSAPGIYQWHPLRHQTCQDSIDSIQMQHYASSPFGAAKGIVPSHVHLADVCATT